MSKTARGDELVTLIQQVHAGELGVEAVQGTQVTRQTGHDTPLSVRDCELLRLVAEGLGNQEIAAR